MADIVLKNASGISKTYNGVDGLVVPDTSGNDVEFGSGSGNYQDKTGIDPTTSSQTIIPDSGYDALSSVQINAIPSQYKDTTGTDVVAANILSGKKAVNTTGQVTGTMANNGATGTTITTQGGTYTIPAGYTTGGTVTATLPVTTLDNTIISGQAFEESTGDYGWKSTVTIPTGYHESQTLEKTFSEIFPAPETEGTADKMLLGYQLYDHSGKIITGTMANNDATTGTISTQGGTFTIPEGYHNGKGKITATLPSGSTGTPTAVKGTVSNNSVSVTPSVTSSTGYITGETVTGTAVTVSASELVSGNKALSSGISAQTGIDVTNYATVSISAIESGTAGTPIATKGTVSNNSISVTPSVTNTTGYITGSTINGTAVTVSASELVSGTETITAGTSAIIETDITNKKYVTVNPTPTETKTVTTNGTVTPTSGKYLSSVTVNVPTPSVSLSSISVTGDWANEQTKGASVDITGLGVDGTFNGIIPPTTTSSTFSGAVTGFTYSPQTWASSGDTQTCTFSYTYNSVTKTATKDYSWVTTLPVGGRIFYVGADNGATYTFYDASGNELTTQTVAGLANAVSYTVSGTPTADKFYVADSTNAMRKYDGTNYCMWATAGEDLSSYSSVFDVLSSAQTTVGTGKRNTAWINTNRNNDTYFPAHNSISGKVTCWDFAKSCNENSVNGCNDWFVPSCGEVTQLRQSGIWGSSLSDWVNTTKYGSNSGSNLWSSSAYSNSDYAWYRFAYVDYSFDRADSYDRYYQYGSYLLCAVRAF